MLFPWTQHPGSVIVRDIRRLFGNFGEPSLIVVNEFVGAVSDRFSLFSSSFGIETPDERRGGTGGGSSRVLGGMAGGLSTLEETGSHSSISPEGSWNKPIFFKMFLLKCT